jgi:hypothetical protein
MILAVTSRAFKFGAILARFQNVSYVFRFSAPSISIIWFLALLMSGLAESRWACAESNSIGIHRSPEGIWTIEVREAQLSDVFKRLTEAMGVPVISVQPPELPLTLRCSGVDIRVIMGCILGSGASVMYRRGLPGNPEGIASVRVLSSSYAKRKSVVSYAESSRVAGILQMTHSEDPGERADGYTRLAQLNVGDATIKRGAFDIGLSDTSGEVRAAALLGLHGLDPEGSREQMLNGLTDVDANVRLAALDVVGVGQGAAAILNQALSDPDELVRELARMRLGLPEHDGHTN